MQFGKVSYVIAALGAIVLAAGCGPEGPYPSRPLTIICPWDHGGGTDGNCRVLAAFVKEQTGQSVNVLNRTGGSGATGHDAGARVRPDGYTLTMITVEIGMLHWRGVTDISWRDFRPIALINREASAVIVRADAPWKTVAELTQAIRENPGKLRASGTAAGGIWHLALTGWLTTAGLRPRDVTWIPSNGAAPSLVELLGGGVDMVTCSLPEARTQLADGQARALGVMSEQRSSVFPDVPTFKELGVDWTLTGWRGVALPRDTPAPIVETIASILKRTVEAPGYRKTMEDIGYDVRFEGPDEFEEFLKEQDDLLGRLLRESGLAE